MHLGVLVCGFEPCLIFKAWSSKIVKLGEVVGMVIRRIQVERHPSLVAAGRELLWGKEDGSAGATLDARNTQCAPRSL